MMIGIRELRNRATQILRSLEQGRSGIVVTRHGRPAALILSIEAPEAEDYVLAHAPELVASMRAADADLRTGRTVGLADYRRRRHI